MISGKQCLRIIFQALFVLIGLKIQSEVSFNKNNLYQCVKLHLYEGIHEDDTTNSQGLKRWDTEDESFSRRQEVLSQLSAKLNHGMFLILRWFAN